MPTDSGGSPTEDGQHPRGPEQRALERPGSEDYRLLLRDHVTERPVHAQVVAHNPASRRVLEKCGFVAAGDGETDAGVRFTAFRLGG